MVVLPRLYPILDAACFSDEKELFAAAGELAAAGCTLIQYRNKSGNARVMLEQARELKTVLGDYGQNPHFSQKRGEMGHPPPRSFPLFEDREGRGTGNGSFVDAPRTRASGAPSSVNLIMNDRADLCLAAGFDGVHVGQDDLSAESVRRIIGDSEDRWLGVSTHNPEQLAEADKTSADYLAIGPIFATSSKEKPDPVVGLEGIRRARQLTRKPLVAIGGITRANAASVIEAGADSVAVISDLLRDPGKSAEEFLRILR